MSNYIFFLLFRQVEKDLLDFDKQKFIKSLYLYLSLLHSINILNSWDNHWVKFDRHIHVVKNSLLSFWRCCIQTRALGNQAWSKGDHCHWYAPFLFHVPYIKIFLVETNVSFLQMEELFQQYLTIVQIWF